MNHHLFWSLIADSCMLAVYIMHSWSYIRRPLARCLEPYFCFPLEKYPSPYPSPGSPASTSQGMRDLPQTLQHRSFFVSFFGIVFVLLFFRFWCHFCSNLAPNLDPKSTQHRSKSHSKSIQNLILFLMPSWTDFWWIFVPTWNPEPSKKLKKQTVF